MDETTGDARPARSAHLDGHPTCSCGQELDICHHAHCPRCGHRIAMSHAVFAA